MEITFKHLSSISLFPFGGWVALELRSTDKVTKFQVTKLQCCSRLGFDSLLFEASLRGMKDKHTLLRQRHFAFGCMTQDERRAQPPNLSPELALPSRLTFLLLPRQIKPLSHSQPSWELHSQPAQDSPAPVPALCTCQSVWEGGEGPCETHLLRCASLGKSLLSF